MGEQLNAGAWLGALLVAGAVVLVANSDGPIHRDRQGLVFGLLAVLCGLSGAFLARQVLISSELTPLQTAAVRLLGGWLALLPILRARGSRFEARSISCASCWPPRWGPRASSCNNWSFRRCPSGWRHADEHRTGGGAGAVRRIRFSPVSAGGRAGLRSGLQRRRILLDRRRLLLKEHPRSNPAPLSGRQADAVLSQTSYRAVGPPSAAAKARSCPAARRVLQPQH